MIEASKCKLKFKILKKKTGFALNPYPQRHSVQQMFFKFNLLHLVFNLSNNISVVHVRANVRETEHDTTFVTF